MGLDVYAGTYVRYYARSWKTVNQQFCEANGLEYHQIRVNDTSPPSVKEITEGVKNWENQLITVLHNSGVPIAEAWEENNEKQYYTDKPDWDAFNALLLYTAAKILGENFPKEFSKNMDIYGHPLMDKIGKTEQVMMGWSLFRGVCHWIPINDGIMFNFPLPNGVSADIAATALLKSELTRINELDWNADRKTILSWKNTEGYPVDADLKSGKIENMQISTMYNTESLAKFAFSILWEAAEFSEKERVPIILDF